MYKLPKNRMFGFQYIASTFGTIMQSQSERRTFINHTIIKPKNLKLHFCHMHHQFQFGVSWQGPLYACAVCECSWLVNSWQQGPLHVCAVCECSLSR